MSLGTAEPASDTGEDTQSAVTLESDFEPKTRRSVHRPPPTSPKSPYSSKPRRVMSWKALKMADSAPLSSRMPLSPQKLWLGTAKQGHAPGTPVYREKEDMYDEIIELKKSLHAQKSDVDLMRTRLRRLEEENSRKDRQIAQLLDPGRGPDFVRTLAEKRPDTGWVINGLRQRVFKLEQQCKEKDSTINKLQTDMKTTNLEEMRIAMETYYEEIHRLQTLLASSDPTAKRPAGERRTSVKRQKKVSSALLSLSRSVQELTEENQSLKEDLDRMLSSSPTNSSIQGYVEWSKPRLLRRIAELEKKINSVESSKTLAAEPDKQKPPAPSACVSPLHRQPPTDCPADLARLRGAVKSLKGERGMLQAQLLEKDVELKQLLQTQAELERQLEHAREGERQSRAQEAALREEIQTLSSKCQQLEEARKEEKEDPEQAAHQAHGEQPAAPASSRLSQQDPKPHPGQEDEEGISQAPSPSLEERREAAARVLQARWRVCQHKKQRAVLNEAAVVLQAAFRGHLARTQLLSSQACDPQPQEPPVAPGPSPAAPAERSPEEAVIVVQCVLRGHLARARLSANSDRAAGTSSAGRRPASAPRGGAALPAPRAASPGEQSGASGHEATADPEEPSTLQAPSAQPPAPGLQPVDDIDSDDSDDVVIAPLLPTKRGPSHPRFLSPPPHDDGCQG